MKNIYNKLKKHKKYVLIGVPVILIILYFMFGRSSNGTETYAVGRADVAQTVKLSGKITTTDKADLGFAEAGRVASIMVKNNQQVTQGQTLAQLEIGGLLSDLKIKELNSKTSDTDLDDAKEELEKVTSQEDTKVENAFRTLLTEDLELTPESKEYDLEPPLVSGAYDGPEGQYKIHLNRSSDTTADLEMLTFGLEKTEQVIKEENSTPLGTKGLYISFPDAPPSSYKGTTWYLDIPNKTSSTYGENLNVYNEAKTARDLAIKNAQSEYQKLLTENGGGDSVAAAEIQKIKAEIRKNTIYAPFSGKVTNIEKEVGESASTGERIISILGENRLEIVLQVSELDVSKLIPGASIKITLDALPGEEFNGTLKTVNSRETEIEGVPVYEAFVELAPDERIKTGMSANGTVMLAKKDNVIAIPTYLIRKEGEKSFVTVIGADSKTKEAEVTTGLTGSDSMVEIISGLNEGDMIVAISAK